MRRIAKVAVGLDETSAKGYSAGMVGVENRYRRSNAGVNILAAGLEQSRATRAGEYIDREKHACTKEVRSRYSTGPSGGGSVWSARGPFRKDQEWAAYEISSRERRGWAGAQWVRSRMGGCSDELQAEEEVRQGEPGLDRRIR